MDRAREEKGFEVGELGKEVLNEWYAEHVPDVGSGKKELKMDPLPQIQVQAVSDEKSEKETKKKEVIKMKLKELLNLGAKKGLSHAIKKAKDSNDPFLLDVFHDILVKDGNYKRILKE